MSSYWDALEAVPDGFDREAWEEDRKAVLAAFAGKHGRGWLRVNCPRCEPKTGKPDKKASLGYNTATGGYNCFKCGTTGKLLESERDELPRLEGAAEEEQLPGDAEAPEPCWGYIPVFAGEGLAMAALQPTRDYYLGRGLTPEAGAAAGVGGATWGMNQGRLLVPLPDYERPEARWRGWVGRAFRAMPPLADGSTPPVYRYARRFRRETYLYNEPALYEETDAPVFVVEGTLDAISLWPDAVALLGKPLEFHKQLLARARRPVAVCLDGDAHEEGWSLAMYLRFMGARAGSIRLPPTKDPDEMERDWLDMEAIRCLE